MSNTNKILDTCFSAKPFLPSETERMVKVVETIKGSPLSDLENDLVWSWFDAWQFSEEGVKSVIAHTVKTDGKFDVVVVDKLLEKLRDIKNAETGLTEELIRAACEMWMESQ